MPFNPENPKASLEFLKQQLFDADRTNDLDEAASLEEEIAELERQKKECPPTADVINKNEDTEDMMNILPEPPYPPHVRTIPKEGSKEIARKAREEIARILKKDNGS